MTDDPLPGDPLTSVRGVAWGCVYSTIIWTILALVAWWALR